MNERPSIWEHVCTEDERIDRYLVGKHPRLGSGAAVRKALKRDELRVDGEHVAGNFRLRPGSKVELFSAEIERHPGLDLALDVLFRDDDLAVIHKPAGLAVSGNLRRCVARALPHTLGRSPHPDALPAAHPVHRLDVPTQGLLLVARTHLAARALTQAFAERRVQKRYEALVQGRLEAAVEVQSPVGGRAARTTFCPLQQGRTPHDATWLTRVAAMPHTGRQHQIRIHAATLGMPILGDTRYGTPGRILKSKGLFLCAVGLEFVHPRTGEPLSFRIEAPRKFTARMGREQRRFDAVLGDL